MNYEPFTSIENPTLAHFRHFSSLFTLSPLYNCRESSTNQLLFMQNKANLLDAQMNVSSILTKDYENKWQRKVGKNKPNSNPIKAKFRTLFPLTARPVRKKTLSSNGARDYNGIFSQISYFQRTPIERSWKWKEKI